MREEASRCPECGAIVEPGADTCTTRWHMLLALDHSHRAPWGPMHGLAFATFMLQHPRSAPSALLDRCWGVLYRLLELHHSPEQVFQDMRALPKNAVVPGAPPRPSSVPSHFGMTIQDLGTFEAESYERLLYEWARATLLGWKTSASSLYCWTVGQIEPIHTG